MKLDTNPKELLALYNVLYERYESGATGTRYDAERSTAETNLHELYKRVKACIIASLTNGAVDPLESWLEGQQRRISELSDQNERVKKDVEDLPVAGGSLSELVDAVTNVILQVAGMTLAQVAPPSKHPEAGSERPCVQLKPSVLSAEDDVGLPESYPRKCHAVPHSRQHSGHRR